MIEDNHSVSRNYSLGMRAFAENRLKDAHKILSKEPEESTCFIMAQGNAALCLYNLNQLDSAEHAFERVVKMLDEKGLDHPPYEIQIRRNYGDVVRDRGRRNEAVQILTDVCKQADTLAADHEEWYSDILLQKAFTVVSLGVAFAKLGQSNEAIQEYENARGMLRTLGNPSRIGEAAIARNLANEYQEQKEFLKAYYSLHEAESVASWTNDRVEAAAARSQLTHLMGTDPEQMRQAALESEKVGHVESALIRWCSAANVYLERQDFPSARRCVRRADTIASAMKSPSPLIPGVYGLEAKLTAWEGGSADEVADLRSKAALAWFKVLSNPALQRNDFDQICIDLHDDLRQLSIALIDVNESKRALLSFELGRAFSMGRDLNVSFIERVVRAQPFSDQHTKISTELIDEVQSQLGEGEVAIVIAELPPNLVSFIVRIDSVEVVSSTIGCSQDDVGQWFNKCHSLSFRLHDGVGRRAIPKQALELGAMIKGLVCDGSIVRLVPYKLTHLLPWRCIFRESGFEWNQLRFVTEFGLLFPHQEVEASDLLSKGALALGYGEVSGIDFHEEAKEFVAAWGDGAILKPKMDFESLKAVLRQANTALVSCHGIQRHGGLHLKIDGSQQGGDGSVSAMDCLPAESNAALLILSACLSGGYVLDDGENPVGFAPMCLRRGTRRVICARWEISATFAKEFVVLLAHNIRCHETLEAAFSESLGSLDESGSDLWRDLACVEIIGQS